MMFSLFFCQQAAAILNRKNPLQEIAPVKNIPIEESNKINLQAQNENSVSENSINANLKYNIPKDSNAQNEFKVGMYAANRRPLKLFHGIVAFIIICAIVIVLVIICIVVVACLNKSVPDRDSSGSGVTVSRSEYQPSTNQQLVSNPAPQKPAPVEEKPQPASQPAQLPDDDYSDSIPSDSGSGVNV